MLFAKPKLISENFHLIDNVKLYSDENKQLFAEILNQSENLLNLDLQNLNDDEKILEIFSEIIQDLKNYELEQRISDLESKFSKDMSESTFNEIKELKKQQKIN